VHRAFSAMVDDNDVLLNPKNENRLCIICIWNFVYLKILGHPCHNVIAIDLAAGIILVDHYYLFWYMSMYKFHFHNSVSGLFSCLS
jgi:hypothetical protein